MVDTSTSNRMNTTCAASGPVTNASVFTLAQNAYIDNPMLEEGSPVSMWHREPQHPQLPIVSVVSYN